MYVSVFSKYSKYSNIEYATYCETYIILKYCSCTVLVPKLLFVQTADSFSFYLIIQMTA